MFRIYMPWNNLGCLGFRVGRFYVDIFRNPFFGVFFHDGKGNRYTFWIRKLRLSKWR